MIEKMRSGNKKASPWSTSSISLPRVAERME